MLFPAGNSEQLQANGVRRKETAHQGGEERYKSHPAVSWRCWNQFLVRSCSGHHSPLFAALHPLTFLLLLLLYSCIVGRPHYRLYAIHHCPNLKYLDYTKIKPKERATAARWAQSAAGAALQEEVVKTFVPGEAIEKRMFSAEEKEGIRQLLANAATVQEVEEIENAVQRGVLPPQLALAKQQGQEQLEPLAKRQEVD